MMTQLPSVDALLESMTWNLKVKLHGRGVDKPLVVGIHTGGAWIAQRLHQALGVEEPLGTLDITFYRDDFTRVGMQPEVKPSELPFDMDDRHLILVDDVLHTGRTIRAALNELFDYGRPASVILAVLVERDGQELPVCADVVGTHLAMGAGEQIKLLGPDDLRLQFQSGRR
jgi:pyrimidine operon attenuation protein/uracil phosphoribosyltransferase